MNTDMNINEKSENLDKVENVDNGGKFETIGNVRVRFAPSPTGYLHVGGARTALFNYLFARHSKGVFILRIEDTDRNRYQADAVDEIFESMRWLGLDWDEGPEKGGDVGPYFQSERTHIYKQYTEELLKKKAAYRCFCTSERLQAIRLEQEKERKENMGYDRFCRNLPNEEVQRLMALNTPFVVRLKIPENETIRFTDLIRGEIEYQSEKLDDIVLLKSDGFPTYHLANVIDDHLMKISHVMRGDEWIASTPRHIVLYRAFGWKPPVFAHLPIILAEGGGKLSKRKGAASVLDFKRAGYLPDALVNFLALLGWAPGDDREIMNRQEMISSFSLERISPKASVFDEKKLEWMSGHYLQSLPTQSLCDEVLKLCTEKGYPVQDYGRSYICTVIDLLKPRSKKVMEIAEQAAYFFTDPQSYEEKSAAKYFVPEAAQLLVKLDETVGKIEPFSAQQIEQSYRQFAESAGMGAGKLIHPTRLAITGVSNGPGLFEIMELLGKKAVIKRIQRAIEYIGNKNAQ